MRIVQALGHLEPGGAVRIARSLEASFVERGATTHLIAMKEHSFALPEPSDQVLSAGAGGGVVATVRAALRLARLLLLTRPDVVISHTPRTAAVVNLVAAACRVPVRTVVQHTPVHHLSTHTRLLDRALGTLGIHSSVVFVGQEVLASFGRLPLTYRDRSRVIVNGVPPQTTSAVVVPKPRQAPTRTRALVVGRLDEDKNVGVLLEALARSDGHIELVVVGDGPSGEDLRSRARELNVDVSFLGQRSPAEVACLYADADVLLFPSRVEALPLVLMEAASAGLPVVASDIPACREVLADAGLFCDSEDVGAWVAALHRLQLDQDLRRHLAASCKERSRYFTLERMTGEYWELLTAMAHGASAEAPEIARVPSGHAA